MLESITPIDHKVQIDVSSYQAVGLTVSGGLDSASLLFMLCEAALKAGKAGAFKVYALTVPNRGDIFCGYFATLVVDFIREHFNNQIEIEHVVKTVDLPGNQKIVIMEEFQKECAAQGKIDAFFDGVTLNPISDDFQFTPPDHSYVERMSHRDYDPSERKFEKKKAYRIDFCRPLANVDKRYIARFWEEKGLKEKMLSITRSCTDRDKVVCGECWWCAERDWAFKS